MKIAGWISSQLFYFWIHPNRCAEANVTVCNKPKTNGMKQFFILLSVCVNFAVKAQTSVYHPFPEAGIIWREDLNGLAFDCCCSGGGMATCLLYDKNQLILNGDTVIGTHTYHKIYRSGYHVSYMMGQFITCPAGCSNYNPHFYSPEYAGAIRQDVAEKKVYFHGAHAGEMDTLLYDFNLEEGDYLPESYNSPAGVNLVSSIDSVLIGNAYHKRFWLDYGQQVKYAAIIEGIGSTYGLCHNLVPPFEFRNELICVKIGSDWVYPGTGTACELDAGMGEIAPSFTFSFSPNPVKNISTLEVSGEFANSQLFIFNETGQEIKRQKLNGTSAEIDRKTLHPGMYFFKVNNEKGETGAGKFLVED